MPSVDGQNVQVDPYAAAALKFSQDLTDDKKNVGTKDIFLRKPFFQGESIKK